MTTFREPPARRRHNWLLAVTVAGTLTLSGVLWLTAAGNLAATGTRIAGLESQRATLAERRARALVAHAQATDPWRLEVRARELGFVPPESVAFVAVTQPGGAGPADVVRLDSPLGVYLSREGLTLPSTAPHALEPGGVLVAADEPLFPEGATLAMAQETGIQP
jgi:hypothetical protein